MTAPHREAALWIGSSAESTATLLFRTYDDLHQSLEMFCTGADLRRRVIRLRGTRVVLNAISLPQDQDPVELHIERMAPGEN